MDKLLVAGIDTIVGGNLAAWLAQRYQVVGLSWGDSLAIAGCETAVCDPSAIDAARTWIASERPQWVVYCGPGARSTWDLPAPAAPHPECVNVAGTWARAAQEFGCELTVISSDAVFTGPWMFHRENGACFCESTPARLLRMIEKEVCDVYPDTLLIRTNAFGWSPSPQAPGLVENVLQSAQEGRPLVLDCMRYATPILATDLADVLDRAYYQKLRGLHHLAGSERINPFRFACLLADQFGYPMSSLDAVETPFESRRGEYGAGETSLQSRRIRRALEVSLPMIRDGLSRLYEQHVSGYRDRFGSLEPALAEQVA
ncbi:MAG TPA: sugar nucleotide-binding protein [Planctomycetaceae bacterium]|nr:sugar nucleotide-binding protein [Planctomycetaceae bacterium]